MAYTPSDLVIVDRIQKSFASDELRERFLVCTFYTASNASGIRSRL